MDSRILVRAAFRSLCLLLTAFAVPSFGAPPEGHLQILYTPDRTPSAGTEVALELEGPGGERRDAVLSPAGDGRFEGLLWNLPAGGYRWRVRGAESRGTSPLEIAPSTMTRVSLRGRWVDDRTQLQPTLSLAGLSCAARDLPGSGAVPLERMATFPDLWSAPSWEGMLFANAARREPVTFRGPLAIGLSSLGFPFLGPAWEEAGWRFTREGAADGRPGLRAAGRIDDSGRREGAARLRASSQGGRARELEIAIRVRDEDDPYPRATADGPRPNSLLQGEDLFGRIGYQGSDASWRVWAGVAGQGREQDYLLRGYEFDREHSPREDWALITGELGFERSVRSRDGADPPPARGPWRSRYRFRVGLTRGFHEVGDGDIFDVLPAYARPDGNAQTAPGGVFWQGDDPRTGFDDGHVYDNYHQTITTSLEGAAGWETIVAARSRLEVEATGVLHALRHYEHFEPTRLDEGMSGNQIVSTFGYSRDGAERVPEGDLEVPELRAGARWESLGPHGSWQASLYGLLYQSRHSGPEDWTRPPDAGGTFEEFEAGLATPGWKGGLGGSVGHAVAWDGAVVWAEGRRTVRRPPLLALGLDPVFLQRSIYLGESRSAFGNPDLGPEKDLWLQTGARVRFARASIPVLAPLFAVLGGGPNLHLQAGLYRAWTRDAWVLKSSAFEDGGLTWVESSGRRSLRGAHFDLRSAEAPPPAGLWFAASYDVSRLTARDGAPLDLDRQWLEPDLPAGSAAVRHTTDTFGSPVAAWKDAGDRPHPLDRTHRASLAAVYALEGGKRGWDVLWSGWSIGSILRWDSGRPYTPIAVAAEGMVLGGDVVYGEIQSGRLPDTVRWDLSLSRRWRFLDRELALRLEVLNVTDRVNALRVYRATGKPDDDGWLATEDGMEIAAVRGEGFAEDYRDALEDPFNFDIPRIFRAAVEITLSGLPRLVGR